MWPVQQSSFIFGQSDGKVKLGNAKGSKTQTIYASESYIVALTSRYYIYQLMSVYISVYSPSGSGVLCGHADGTIVRYTFTDEDSDMSKV